MLGRRRADRQPARPGLCAWERGEVVLPARPGWGADLVEAVARKHVWEPGRLPGYSAAIRMYRR
jgi:hypothetical protein